MPTYQIILKSTIENSSLYIQDFAKVVRMLRVSGINPRGIQCLGDRPLPKLLKKGEARNFLARFISVDPVGSI